MIKEFLNKYQQELLSEKIELTEELDLIMTKIKENEKFLDLLRKDNNQIFAEFSPREMTQKNDDRILEIEKNLKIDIERRDFINASLSLLEGKLRELNDIFHSDEYKTLS